MSTATATKSHTKKHVGITALALVMVDLIVSLIFGAGLFHAVTNFDAVHAFDMAQCAMGKSDPGYCRNISR